MLRVPHHRYVFPGDEWKAHTKCGTTDALSPNSPWYRNHSSITLCLTPWSILLFRKSIRSSPSDTPLQITSHCRHILRQGNSVESPRQAATVALHVNWRVGLPDIMKSFWNLALIFFCLPYEGIIQCEGHCNLHSTFKNKTLVAMARSCQDLAFRRSLDHQSVRQPLTYRVTHMSGFSRCRTHFHLGHAGSGSSRLPSERSS